MATKTVPRAPGEPLNLPSRVAKDSSARIDVEREGFFADSMLALADWVEEAREALAGLQLAVQVDPSLAERLSAMNALHCVEWGSPASEGLRCLLTTAREKARVVSAAVAGQEA